MNPFRTLLLFIRGLIDRLLWLTWKTDVTYYCRFAGNTVSNCCYSIEFTGAGQNVVSGNTMTGCSNGIWLGYS